MAVATLLNLQITTAVTAAVSPALAAIESPPSGVLLEAIFSYGSGGTSADAWVQTSVDGGATWIDVANFHFTTSSASALFNLSAATPITTQYTPTDGTLAANTAKDGIIGPIWRIKYTTVGTYAGGTSLKVCASVPGSNRFVGIP